MGRAKYPIMSKTFDRDVIAASEPGRDRGLVTLFVLTGMHVSSTKALTPTSLIREGERLYVVWVRPKTRRMLKSPPLPPDMLDDIKAFLSSRKCSRQYYDRLVKDVGLRAGYDGISSMTFRHNRCVRLVESGLQIPVICQIMGCTPDVVYKAYSKLHEEQLMVEQEKERDVEAGRTTEGRR